jgi:hypothetical protein
MVRVINLLSVWILDGANNMNNNVVRLPVTSDGSKSFYRYSFRAPGKIPVTLAINKPYYTANVGDLSFQQYISIDPNVFLKDIKSIQFQWRLNYNGLDAGAVNWDVILQGMGPLLIANERTGKCVYVAPDYKVFVGPLASDFGPQQIIISGAEPFNATVNDIVDVFFISPAKTPIPLPNGTYLGALDLYLCDFETEPFRNTTSTTYVAGT